MNVCFRLLGWLQLDYEVDVGDVKTSRCDISGNQNAEFAFLEALHCHFSLILGNISVHNLNILLDFIREQERVGICFRLREHNDFSTFAINNKNISQC